MSSVISCLLPGAEWDRGTTGLLGEAERLAERVDAQHIVVSVGVADEIEQSAARHADRVLAIRFPEGGDYRMETCLAALHTVCSELQPRVILLGQDTSSQEAAPRLAYRMNGCSIADGQQIEVRGDKVHVKRSVYGGKASAVVRANLEPAIIWLRARTFAPAAVRSAGCQPEAREWNAGPTAGPEIVKRDRPARTGVRLEDAQVIVSGGRGLGGPEPFEELRELAREMKAELAASRAACDAGWVPPSWQVGQTGKKVSPELYLAIGISGASQHLMGIADAKIVAAVNTDPDAPIFRHCHFGLVEDWKQVVAPLRDWIVELSGE